MSAPAGYTIHVSGLAPETTEEKLHDFFSFCGKLTKVTKTGTTAEITFEKLSAMRTSLMLNGGSLDGAHIEVKSETEEEPKAASVLPTGATGATPIGAATDSGFSQEDKPKAAIVAEYLAHGYVMGDHIIQRAIDLDQKHGISNRFLTFFNDMDHQVGHRVVGENKTVSGKVAEQAQHVVNKTKEVDQNRGVSASFQNYYSRAKGTPFGQRVHQFYTETSKQVLDVHEEARRIADEQDAKKSAANPAAAAGATDTAAAAPANPAATAAATAPPAAAASATEAKAAEAGAPTTAPVTQ